MKVLWINGRAVDVSATGAHENLLSLLRDHGWTGAKCGCAEGDCGACSVVLVDERGKPRSINSCLALVRSLEGREIRTAEGFGKEGKLHPVQEKMIGCYGSQCGYCTPGFISSMVETYHRDGNPGPAEISDGLCGNLCRCTGYRPIRDAMMRALAEKGEGDVAFESPRLDEPAIRAVPTLSDGGGNYLRPESLEELLELRSSLPDACLVAGATEVAVLINKRMRRHDTLIGLEKVEELRRIEVEEDEWILGAGAALTDIADAMRGEYPAFDKMLELFASRQIRHRATLGGNLVTASPIGDAAPVLLALDAEVVLRSKRETRTVKLADFFTGYRRTVLLPDEVMVAVRVPRGLPGKCEFFKVSKRREMDISIVSAAFRVVTGGDGKIVDARLAFGGVAAMPMRARKAEAALIGRRLEVDGGFSELLAGEFEPLSDVRAGADYRLALIRGLWEKFVGEERGAPMDEPVEFVPGRPAEEGGLHHESAAGHVTGKAIYTFDQALRRPMLEIWPILSPVAKGTLERVDASRAEGMPGVRKILFARDVPGLNNVGPVRHDEPLFAEEEICFHGQIIGVVIGDSEAECRRAAEMVEVRVVPAAPLLGIEEGIRLGSFHTDPHVLERGGAAAVLENAEHLLEGGFPIGGQEHFYLETHAAWAEPDGEGGVHVVSSTQHPSEVQAVVAEVLGCSRNQVVVVSPRMGGGFGGKETQGNAWAAICALAATVTGRAVRVQVDRDLDMKLTGKRHPFYARYRVAHDGEGRLQAAEIDVFSDGGWSLDLSQPVNDRALFHLDNAYHIPHVRFTGRVVKTNTTSHTAFRGFGGPQGMLIIEEIMGRIALRLGLPPEEVRRRNFYQAEGGGNVTHYGAAVGDVRIHRMWERLMETSDFAKRKAEIRGWNAGRKSLKRGIAITPVKFGISFTLKSYNQAGALVLIYQDGSVQVNHGGTEMGQGLHTKILGVAMRELGLPEKSIRLMQTRTDKVPNTSATAASAGADLNGMAVADACGKLRGRLAQVAAEILGGTPGEVEFSDGKAVCGEASIPFADLAKEAYLKRVQLSATGFYRTPGLDWDWNVGKGRPFYYYAWGAAVCEVEVDGHTGMSRVLRVDILHDTGKSLNPDVDRGQIEGGFVQGMGWLTCEELKWNEEGVLLSHGASTYAIPSFGDAPRDFRVELLPDAEQEGTIHGSKAVGEPPFMLAISVREAIRDAVAAFRGEGDFDLPSPCTGEAVKLAIGGCVMSQGAWASRPPDPGCGRDAHAP